MVHVRKCPLGERGKASTEFYIGRNPQIYCQGWIDQMNDEYLPECKKCLDHVSNAEADLIALKRHERR